MITTPSQNLARLTPAALAAMLALLVAAPASASSADAATPAATVLTLEDALALALENDELLRQAAEGVAAAEADLLAAGAGRLPQLALAGEWTANLKKPAFFLPPEFSSGFGGATKVEMGRDNSFEGAASLTWNLWTAGRLSAGVGAARELVSASRWQRAVVADAVRYRVTAAYLDALLAAERVGIAAEARATAAEALRIARAGFEQGTVSRFDVLRAEVELANREAPLIQARNARRQAHLALARDCGLEEPVSLVLADTLAATPIPPDAATLVAAMHEHSPELRTLERQVAAREQSLALARATRGPTVQLRGRYALQAEWDDGLTPDENERAASAAAGIAVSVPIFDGLQARADIAGAEARLRSAEIELERLVRDRELAVRRARLQLESALASLAGRRESVALAREAHRLAVIRLENGLATPLERLDAQLALTEARVQFAESLHACNVALAALRLAVGGDLELASPVAEEERS